MLEFKVSGLEQLRRDLREVTNEIATKVIDKAARAAALHFAREARMRCRSSDVARSIKVFRLPGENGAKQFTYIVSAGKGARVAHLLEFGTKQHPIVPNAKNRKAKNIVRHATGKGATIAQSGHMALRIGSEFMPRIKMHPGAKSKPFMRPTFDEQYNDAIDAFVKAAEAALASLARRGALPGQYWGGA